MYIWIPFILIVGKDPIQVTESKLLSCCTALSSFNSAWKLVDSGIMTNIEYSGKIVVPVYLENNSDKYLQTSFKFMQDTIKR